MEGYVYEDGRDGEEACVEVCDCRCKRRGLGRRELGGVVNCVVWHCERMVTR